MNHLLLNETCCCPDLKLPFNLAIRGSEPMHAGTFRLHSSRQKWISAIDAVVTGRMHPQVPVFVATMMDSLREKKLWILCPH
jgi:hypothetical protein